MRGVNMSVYYGAGCLKVAVGNGEWGVRSGEWEANFAIAKLQSSTKVLIISLKYYFWGINGIKWIVIVS